MHTEVCIGLDIAHFLSLMYGFIMQQIYIYILSPYRTNAAFLPFGLVYIVVFSSLEQLAFISNHQMQNKQL